MITANDLHEAADWVAELGEEVDEALGLNPLALEGFIFGSTWRGENPVGPRLKLEPLALALGISIGIRAQQAR